MSEGVKKGEWEKRYRYNNTWNFRCSECKKTCPQSAREEPTYEFCPHCGIPMKVGGECENEKSM